MERLDPALDAELRAHFLERFIESWPGRDIDVDEIEEVSFGFEPDAEPPYEPVLLEVAFRVTGSTRQYSWSGARSDAITIVEEIAELNAADAEYDRRVRTGEQPRRERPGS